MPSPSPIHPEPESIPPNVTSSPSDQFTSTSDVSTSSNTLNPVETLSNIPERIGYLKEVCGIDFGWGPSSMMEMLLENIHIYGGFPWATSIALLAICSRLILLFPTLRASDMGAQYKAAKPVIEPVQLRVSAAYRAKDYAKMSEAKAELDALHKGYGIKRSAMFLPILLQIPIQFGGFRLLRNMAELPVPALEKENWLWTQDLTLSDPYFLLPFANASMIYLTIRVCDSFIIPSLLHG
jgi:YidC/Oxa1 family membrane protein insertase